MVDFDANVKSYTHLLPACGFAINVGNVLGSVVSSFGSHIHPPNPDEVIRDISQLSNPLIT